ncbi:MAG: hypothetical protein ACRDRO_20130 [Pseudonocardiaceae bacterium]
MTPDPVAGPVTCWLREHPRLRAWRITDTNRPDIARWCGADKHLPVGHYVMRGITGEFFLVDPERFARTYEVEEAPGDDTTGS